ncbi:MAG: tetratricopeptide repeat protein [Deltaproteobacteria bacterium]|nr:tetratricopeptide repeat protein [Deltaproteobacteria bacterium]
MDRTQGAGRRVIVYDEIFQYPLGLAVVFMLVLLALRDTPKAAAAEESEPAEAEPGRPAAKGAKLPEATLGLALVFLGWAALQPSEARAAARTLGEYSDTKKGVESYEDKDYAAAVQHFGKAQASNPESGKHHMNLGDALLKAGSVEGAVQEFTAASKDKDPIEGARGAFNLGKTFEEAKDFEKALRAYQQGLDRLAEDPKSDSEVEARIKRALEQAIQKKQQQQQQQQQQQGQGGGQGGGKDDKKEQQDKKEKENQKYEISKKKPQFKDEKLSEGDAKRLLKQLQEQEKKSQQRVMRAKTGKPKDDKITKDW